MPPELPFTGLARHLAKRATPWIGVGFIPVWVIQEIEDLEAELQPLRLRYGGILANPQVPRPEAWTTQAIARLYVQKSQERERPVKGVQRQFIDVIKMMTCVPSRLEMSQYGRSSYASGRVPVTS